MPREIHVELLLHRRVDDPAGKALGRIEEIVVNDKGEILEFRLGPAALMQRWLGAFAKKARPMRVAWNEIDLFPAKGRRIRARVYAQPLS